MAINNEIHLNQYYYNYILYQGKIYIIKIYIILLNMSANINYHYIILRY